MSRLVLEPGGITRPALQERVLGMPADCIREELEKVHAGLQASSDACNEACNILAGLGLAAAGTAPGPPASAAATKEQDADVVVQLRRQIAQVPSTFPISAFVMYGHGT